MLPAGFECASCVFWHPMTPKSGNPQTRGQCRARAPMLVNRPDGAIFSSWPLTKEDDGCGDHSTLTEERA